MKATLWEFTNRAILFGAIFGISFLFYSFDHENATALLANWLGARHHLNGDLIARLLFWSAACLLAAAAMLRTWASSYLKASVVYAADVKSETLVADGPYRRTRNPLYFANVMMAVAMGTMMSRIGYVFSVAAMLWFCYRLIFREEEELATTQGEHYRAYCRAVPRFWPSLQDRVATAGGRSNWAAGFKAESWYWGFALALAGFALTLNLGLFWAVLGISLALFWLLSTVL